jgi:hypothetical protein
MNDPNPQIDVFRVIKGIACFLLLLAGIVLISIGIFWFASAMRDSSSLFASSDGDFVKIVEEAKMHC